MRLKTWAYSRTGHIKKAAHFDPPQNPLATLFEIVKLKLHGKDDTSEYDFTYSAETYIANRRLS